MSKKITIALAGNPNVGKSTLFSAITGARQHIGNWPGVTVEKKSGEVRHRDCDIVVVDLPGTYSLTAYSADEVIARDFIIEEKPDVVVQVVDATSLERNLYLTTQLSELGVPMVIALNMSDMAEQRGDVIDREKLAEFLEMPVVRTVGNRNEGIADLLDAVIEEARSTPHHEHSIGYGDQAEQVIASLIEALKVDKSLTSRYPPRWLAVRLLEGDEDVLKKISESSARHPVFSILAEIDAGEYEALMADRRYEVISAILPQACVTCVKEMTSSDLIDRVVTNRYLGIPIFFALMWGAFELTFTVASPFMAMIEAAQAACAEAASALQPEWFATLVGEGLIGGVGSVLIFLPNIFILLFLLAILEDSGYLARAAFVMDRLMYSIGLPGRSFIPMLVGFGCNVPAIMATRTIEDKNDRLITILINPFISCGARLPVFVLFAGIFFPENPGTVIFCLYVLGIAVAIVSAKLFRATILPGKPAPFLMEMPPYRLPTATTSVRHMWDRGSMYIRKAGGIILIGAVVIWALAAYPAGVGYGSAESFAGMIGQILQPVFAPLGFDWKVTISLIFGFMAKEIVVASLGTLYGTGEEAGALEGAILGDPMLGQVTALALMVFVLLYLPCIATMAVIRKETGSWKWAAFSVGYGIFIAYLMALIVTLGGAFLAGAWIL